MTYVIGSLFVVVAALLGYGIYAFRSAGSVGKERTVNMRLEVLWTGMAAALLLAIFVYVR